jgi:hypothetical protein
VSSGKWRPLQEDPLDRLVEAEESIVGFDKWNEEDQKELY